MQVFPISRAWRAVLRGRCSRTFYPSGGGDHTSSPKAVEGSRRQCWVLEAVRPGIQSPWRGPPGRAPGTLGNPEPGQGSWRQWGVQTPARNNFLPDSVTAPPAAQMPQGHGEARQSISKPPAPGLSGDQDALPKPALRACVLSPAKQLWPAPSHPSPRTRTRTHTPGSCLGPEAHR